MCMNGTRSTSKTAAELDMSKVTEQSWTSNYLVSKVHPPQQAPSPGFLDESLDARIISW